MHTGSSGLPERLIKIKQGDKFPNRPPSRENAMTNPSLEVYYGGVSVAIPFQWESQPGTPKVKFHDVPLPPLTPPPSFHFSPGNKPISKHSKSNLLRDVLPKLVLRKNFLPQYPASSSSSPWPSSHSVPCSPCAPNLQRQFALSRSSTDSRIDEQDEHGSPASTFCFGIGRGASAKSHGCSSSIIKVLLRDITA
ncbi:uncharacterized protein LOC132268390 [Cornus florida]|uniref:uncharacterized protein LOC132268390 n=1 Tax=Cornus florida TaxID=4283 RepID=UPI002897E7F3|nr:uncharacterized protein LOC132268390 [Cornus florida]